jgi:hypothetical protein
MAREQSTHGAAVAEHAVWKELTALVEASQETADSEEPDGEPWQERHQWTQYVLDQVRTRIQQADPQLVPVSQLEVMRTAAVSAREQLDNYRSNGQDTHLEAATKHVDSLLVAAGVLPPLPPSEEAAATARALERVSDLVDETADAGRKQVEALRERGEELAEAHAAELTERDNRLTELAETHQAAVEKRDAQIGKLDTAVDELRAEVAETARQLEVAEQEERERWSSRAQATLKEIEQLRQQASNLVSAKGAEIVAGGYMDYAKEQRKQADKWRYGSVGIAGAAVAFLLLVFLTGGDDGSVASAVRAGLISAALLGIAGYAGRQSGIHRRREQSAYKSGLEATAIEPFIANLPAEEKSRVRRVFAEHFFSQPIDESDVDSDADEPITRNQLFSLLRTAVERK